MKAFDFKNILKPLNDLNSQKSRKKELLKKSLYL